MLPLRLLVIIAIVLVSIGAFVLISPNIPARSSVNDAVGDAVPVRVHETALEPVLQPYHDIRSASVQRLNGKELVLTLELLGDPNLNTEHEIVYIWVMEYPTIVGTQRYTIIVPHFPSELGLSAGWHIAIFDNNAQRYVVPLKSIGSMPGKVEVNIDPKLMGNPSFFWWQAFVMIRVELQFDRPPDFLVDSAPDNYTVLLGPFS
ncbi:MAG: hypothetical protein QXU32_03290 [Nitrososphaerales archaeon]